MGLWAPLNPLLHDWHGRGVWLVGASTGIGRALADALLARGAQVVVSARPSAALAGLAGTHPALRTLALDVTDAAAVAIAASQAQALLPRLDMVVMCAGTYSPMGVNDFDVAVIRRHWEVNYLGTLHVLAAVLPRLRAQASGHVCVVGSVAGYRALPKALAYGPTKAALIHLAQGLHLELAPQGLGVSLVNPGFVATPLTAQNDFAMPALQTPAQAAHAILAGWARGDFEIHFPRRFSYALKALGWLPTRAYEAVVRRITGA